MNKLLLELGAFLQNPNSTDLRQLIVRNLPPTSHAVYTSISLHPNSTLRDVTSNLDMSQPHAANVLRNLVKLGLVERYRNGVYKYRVIQ